MENRLTMLEERNSKFDRRLAELTGKCQGTSETLQDVLHQREELHLKFDDWRHHLEENVREKQISFEQKHQKTISSSSVAICAIEDTLRTQQQRLCSFEALFEERGKNLYNTKRDIIVLHRKLDTLTKQVQCTSAQSQASCKLCADIEEFSVEPESKRQVYDVSEGTTAEVVDKFNSHGSGNERTELISTEAYTSNACERKEAISCKLLAQRVSACEQSMVLTSQHVVSCQNDVRQAKLAVEGARLAAETGKKELSSVLSMHLLPLERSLAAVSEALHISSNDPEAVTENTRASNGFDEQGFEGTGQMQQSVDGRWDGQIDGLLARLTSCENLLKTFEKGLRCLQSQTNSQGDQVSCLANRFKEVEVLMVRKEDAPIGEGMPAPFNVTAPELKVKHSWSLESTAKKTHSSALTATESEIHKFVQRETDLTSLINKCKQIHSVCSNMSFSGLHADSKANALAEKVVDLTSCVADLVDMILHESVRVGSDDRLIQDAVTAIGNQIEPAAKAHMEHNTSSNEGDDCDIECNAHELAGLTV